MLIAVGSQNPAKIEAVRLGIEAMFPRQNYSLMGTAADSGISNQPMSAEETLTGARNRAQHALDLIPKADYSIGLEGGIFEVHGHWVDMAWIVVRDKEGNEGMGATVGMPLKSEIIRVMKEENLELGFALDQVLGTVNIKQAQGYFGHLTDNRITRTTAYSDAVIVAFSHLLHQATGVAASTGISRID